MLGLKLDGGGGTDGSSILPTTAMNPNKDNLYARAGSFSSRAGHVENARVRYGELKAGDLFLTNPVIAGGATADAAA
jgi:hypothetical protein